MQSTTQRGKAPALLLLAAASLLIPSCSNKDRDVLFHAIDVVPYGSLDPSIEQSEGTGILHNVYETLTVYDDTAMQVKPCLAESWTCNATMTEWTFHLRQDVFFHDGKPLTAQAVKLSIERTVALGMGASYIWDCLDAIEAPDKLTVTFKLKYASSIPLIASSSSAAYIFSPQAMDKTEDWFNEGNDAGSGPYCIAAASKNSVALSAFPGYRNVWPAKKFKKIFIAEIPDRTRRTDYLGKKEADIVFFPDMDKLSEMKGVKLQMGSSWLSVIMMFNTQKSPCSNEDFRKALAYAFPYSELTDDILKGQGKPSKGMIPAGLWGYDDSLPSYSRDLDKAREHLEKSGLDGELLTLTYQPGRDELDAAIELFKQNLEKIGVKLLPLKIEWSRQQAVAMSENEQARQDIMIMDWFPDYANPEGTFHPLLADQNLDSGFNYCYLKDTEIEQDIRLASMLAPTHQEEAAKIYGRVQHKVLDRCYLLFLYDTATPIAYRSNIGPVRINPAYELSLYYYDIERLHN